MCLGWEPRPLCPSAFSTENLIPGISRQVASAGSMVPSEVPFPIPWHRLSLRGVCSYSLNAVAPISLPWVFLVLHTLHAKDVRRAAGRALQNFCVIMPRIQPVISDNSDRSPSCLWVWCALNVCSGSQCSVAFRSCNTAHLSSIGCLLYGY